VAALGVRIHFLGCGVFGDVVRSGFFIYKYIYIYIYIYIYNYNTMNDVSNNKKNIKKVKNE